MSEEVKIRPSCTEDLPFVLGSWVQSTKCSIIGKINDESHNREMRQSIRELFETKRARILVACDADDATKIIGWIVYEPSSSGPIVRFVYVKHEYRSKGCMRLLLDKIGVQSLIRTSAIPRPGLAKRLIELGYKIHLEVEFK